VWTFPTWTLLAETLPGSLARRLWAFISTLSTELWYPEASQRH
jgi:hypothetical protein